MLRNYKSSGVSTKYEPIRVKILPRIQSTESTFNYIAKCCNICSCVTNQGVGGAINNFDKNYEMMTPYLVIMTQQIDIIHVMQCPAVIVLLHTFVMVVDLISSRFYGGNCLVP